MSESITWRRVPLRTGHIYQAETKLFTLQLWHRNAVRRGRQFKYKLWMLYVNGRPVNGSKRYRLRDAQAFAAEWLASRG